MNLKTITIALTVLVFAVLATVIMQKGSYVSQATEHYEKTTGNSFNGTSRILKFVNESIETNKTLWLMTCDAVQNVKTAKQMAELESKYFPGIKGNMSIAQKNRKFEATMAYYIVSYYSNVEVDKKTDVKTLTGLTAIDVNALLGNAVVSSGDEEGEEGEGAVEGAEGEAAEAAVEEAPAPEPKKAAKGKKGKKGKKKR